MVSHQLRQLLSTDFDGAWGEVAPDHGGLRVIRSTEMRGGRLDLSSAALRDIPPLTARKKALAHGDILVNKSSGSQHLVGASVLFEYDGDKTYLCSNFIRCLRPNHELVDSEFLYWALQSPQFRDQVFGAQRTTSGLRNLKIEEFKTATIPLPSKPDQRRIVARIRECMDRIIEIEQLALSADSKWSALGQSLVEDELASVGGEEILLGEVAKIGSDLVDPTQPQYFDLPHVGGANIESKTGRLLDIKTAREEKLKSSKFTFSPHMVLYNKIRPYLVKVARPNFVGLCSADMYPLHPSSVLSRDFLYYQLTSLHFTEYAISGSNRAGMPKVNREHLFAYRFKLPCIEEQVIVSEKLDHAMGALESARIVLREKADVVKAMRQSVLAMAFAGEM